MTWLVLATLTLVPPLTFVAFVVLGGLLVRGRPRLAVAHLLAASWGAYVSFANQVCPLTPLENAFLRRAGSAGYEGGFLEHYVVPVLYPGALTPGIQRLLGAGVVLANVLVYGWVLRSKAKQRSLARRMW